MSEQSTQGSRLGRRERAKLDRRRRLLDVAAELFAHRGYGAVTTQEIADAADVGAGTLFRYFPTKADLLVEVMSAEIDTGIRRAIAATDTGADPVQAIVALIAPLARAGAQQPENIVAYLRETLFGPPNLRAISVAHGMAIPEAIENILARYADEHPVQDGVNFRDVADAIYAMVWFEGIKVITQGQQIRAERAHHIVEFVIHGLFLNDPRSRSASTNLRRILP